LTNLQLSLSKITGAAWQADLFNDQDYCQPCNDYAPPVTVNYLNKGHEEPLKSWSPLDGDEDKANYKDTLLPLEETLQLCTKTIT